MPDPAAISNDDQPLPDLSLEDFRRLGVRPFECRQTVIRLAALRSSRSLAKQQLSAPSEQGTLQLSRVMASAYRLLDPRRRDDPMQRALVGRIMPHALSVAGRTEFQNGLQKDGARVPMIETFGPDDQHQYFLSGETERQPPWTISLSEKDLVDKSPVLQRIKQSKHRSRAKHANYTWITIVAGGLLIGAVTGLATIGNRDGLAQNQPHQESSANETSQSNGEQIPETLPVVDEPELASIATDPTESPVVSVEHESRQSEPIESTSDPSPTEIPLASPPANGDSLPKQSPKIIVAPAVEIARLERSPATQPPRPEEVQQLETLSLYKVPGNVDMRAARRSMTTEIPALSESIDISSITQRLDDIEKFRNAQTVGSAEHWAATIAITQLHWLIDDMDQVIHQLAILSEPYQARFPIELSSSFVQACAMARMPETYLHLFAGGLRLADYLLVNESLQECQQVVDALSQMNQYADNAQTQQRLREYSDSIEQMERFSVATRRWDQQEDKNSITKDAGIAGRYYCLMLRQWRIGLPWLVAASDKRIARIAEQDLDAKQSEDRIATAKRWIDVSKRYDGRVSHSMRLRGIELIRESLSESTAISRLQMERRIAETEKLVPADLHAGLADRPLTRSKP